MRHMTLNHLTCNLHPLAINNADEPIKLKNKTIPVIMIAVFVYVPKFLGKFCRIQPLYTNIFSQFFLFRPVHYKHDS